MLHPLKYLFHLSDAKNLIFASLQIILSLLSFAKKQIKVKFNLLVSCKENFVSNRFIQELLSIDFIENVLKDIDLNSFYENLLKSEELNQNDLNFLEYLSMLIIQPIYFLELTFHVGLETIKNNIYSITIMGISFNLNQETIKDSYNKKLIGISEVSFITGKHSFYDEGIENFSFEFNKTIKNYLSKLLSDYFSEGTNGNFIERNHSLFFVDSD